MEGFAYVFLRKNGAPLPQGCAGHVGWGFSIQKTPNDTDAICGSTENFSGSAVILPGQDNGFWMKRFDKEAEMFFEFKRRNYDACKKMRVPVASPDSAHSEASKQRGGGYTALGNNCLDHVYRVLAAYGEPGLPWPSTHPSPNDWFAVLNGTYVAL